MSDLHAMGRAHRDERSGSQSGEGHHDTNVHLNATDRAHHDACKELNDHGENRKIGVLDDFLDRDIPDDARQPQHANGYVVDAPYP